MTRLIQGLASGFTRGLRRSFATRDTSSPRASVQGYRISPSLLPSRAWRRQNVLSYTGHSFATLRTKAKSASQSGQRSTPRHSPTRRPTEQAQVPPCPTMKRGMRGERGGSTCCSTPLRLDVLRDPAEAVRVRGGESENETHRCTDKLTHPSP